MLQPPGHLAKAYNSYVAFLPGVGYRLATEQGMLTLSREKIGRLVREYVYLDEVKDWTPQVWQESYAMRAAATGLNSSTLKRNEVSATKDADLVAFGKALESLYSAFVSPTG